VPDSADGESERLPTRRLPSAHTSYKYGGTGHGGVVVRGCRASVCFDWQSGRARTVDFRKTIHCSEVTVTLAFCCSPCGAFIPCLYELAMSDSPAIAARS
jgi:hypothetical protein